MIQIQIFPRLDQKVFRLHEGDKNCSCHPKAVIFKKKLFVFHRDLERDEPEYDPQEHADLPEAYRRFIEAYLRKNRAALGAGDPEMPNGVHNGYAAPPDLQPEKNGSLFGISRIDSKNTHGWFVRVYSKGKVLSKLFSDKKCGGREAALELAVEHRDTLRAELGLPKEKQAPAKKPLHRKKRRSGKGPLRGRYSVRWAMRKYARTRTGVVGVYRSRKADGQEHYVANYKTSPKKRHSKGFSIEKYGEEEAFTMACELREKFLERYIKIHG